MTISVVRPGALISVSGPTLPATMFPASDTAPILLLPPAPLLARVTSQAAVSDVVPEVVKEQGPVDVEPRDDTPPAPDGDGPPSCRA
jgi:hypothetical protein